MRQFIGDIAGGGAFDDAFIAPQAAELAGGGFEKRDINWVINALTVFLEPWIKDNNPNRRWYDVQSR